MSVIRWILDEEFVGGGQPQRDWLSHLWLNLDRAGLGQDLLDPDRGSGLEADGPDELQERPGLVEDPRDCTLVTCL